MLTERSFYRDSYIHSLDPRVRVLVSVALSVAIALSGRASVVALGLGLALLLACVARLPLRPMCRRLLALNAFMAMLVLLLPLTMPGETFARVGPLAASREGLARACTIALKSNAIVMTVAALMATIEVERLGHALSRLAVPGKLTHLFLFTVRYVGVLVREHARLAAAMKVRCFRPGMNRHTYRSFGYLVGMLLVRSFDRSERILAAMKCRGFRGRYYVLDRLAIAGRDVAFAVAASLALAALLWAEVAWPTH